MRYLYKIYSVLDYCLNFQIFFPIQFLIFRLDSEQRRIKLLERLLSDMTVQRKLFHLDEHVRITHPDVLVQIKVYYKTASTSYEISQMDQ